jgi:hypothetical protein
LTKTPETEEEEEEEEEKEALWFLSTSGDLSANVMQYLQSLVG